MKFHPLWWIVPGTHRRWRTTHATRHYYDCARELDLPPWETVSHVPSLELRGPEREDARRFLAAQGVALGGHPLVALHAGAAGLGGLKQWSPRRFAALADRLQRAWNAGVLLLGGRDDVPLLDQVTAAMRTAPIVAAGATSLLISCALIEACDLFIGNDSGPLHVAAAVGTPYVGIYGPTVPANFHPIPRWPGQGVLAQPAQPCRSPRYFVGGDVVWRRPCRCCHGRCRALTTITVDEVYEAAARVLQARRAGDAVAVPTRSALPVSQAVARGS